MPIIRTYGDPGILGGLAYDAGKQSGIADRLAQQRAIDAQFVNERLRAREEITRMESAANLAGQMGGGRGGGGSSTPARTGPEETINQFARQRQEAQDQQLQQRALQAENDARLRTMTAALDQAYEGREKDFAYEYAKERLRNGQTIPDRMLSALGIQDASDAEAKARKKAEDEKGIIDTAEPRTDQERLIRRSFVQGRPGDVASMLDQRDRRQTNFQTGEAPLTRDALAARTQLQGFAESTSDRTVLEQMRATLAEKKVSPEALAPLDARIEALKREDIELKAPVAFEQAIGAFQSQLTAMQKKEGRALNVSERRGLLAKNLEQTAKSFGLTIGQIGEFVRANDERRREAEMLVEQAQAAIMQAQTQQMQQAPGAGRTGDPAGNPQQPRPRRPDFGQPGRME